MPGRIPDDVLDSIRERTSIVEIVSGHIALKRAGRNFVGLCPFHNEKTPSFTVSEDRGLYHCFGCGESGTVFTFLMKVDGIDFIGAVEQLARKAGVHLPEEGGSQRREDRDRWYQLNEAAQRRYVDVLRSPDGAAARAYLARRGTADETIERFGLGFCPAEAGGLTNAIRDRPMAITAAMALGIVGRRPDGRLFDRQWGRITFPIRDGSGRIVGFGGRALEDRQPKYLNSPESPLFHKGRVLYGLFEARAAIRSTARVVIVEGYMDVLALAQSGIANVVANLGTALTEDQLRLAKRHGAAETVVFFDGDRAGRAAALRTFELCAEADLLAYGAFLPEGEDPDSFVRARGADATRALIEAPTALADYFLDAVDPGAGASLLQRQEAARRVGGVLGRVHDPVQFGILARLAAERLQLDEGVFRELRRGGSRGRPALHDANRAGSESAATPLVALTPEESTLLEAMALGRDSCELAVASVEIEAVLSPAAATIARQIAAAWMSSDSIETTIDCLPREFAERAAAAAFGQGPLANIDRNQVVRDCLVRLERRRRALQLRDARDRLRRADRDGDVDRIREGVRETHRLLPPAAPRPSGRT